MHWQGTKGEPGLQGLPGASGLKVIHCVLMYLGMFSTMQFSHFLVRLTVVLRKDMWNEGWN